MSTLSTILTKSTNPPTLGSKEASNPMALMQVREAARALGVHENTLRRWADAGYIKPVKLPSGVRRFREIDVIATKDRMFEGLAPVPEPNDPTKASAEAATPTSQWHGLR